MRRKVTENERERERERKRTYRRALRCVQNSTEHDDLLWRRRGLKLACGGRGGSVGPPGSVDAREIQNPYIKTQPSQTATARLIQNNIMGAAT